MSEQGIPKMRTDVHAPVNFVPENYKFIGVYDNSPDDDEVVSDAEAQYAELVAASKSSKYHNGFQCDHCGARIRYVGVMQHMPTGDYIAVGETCLSGRFTYSKAQFDALKKQAELAREQKRLLVAWTAYKAEHPADWAALEASENGFVQNVLHKGRRLYGNISDKQFAAIQQAVVRDAEYAARKAAEVVEATVPVPEGKVTIEGVVLTLKWQDSDFGGGMKMLVKVTTPEGSFKVWGSKPKSLDDSYNHIGCVETPGVEVGDVVKFAAQVEQSKDDAAFGFFKRPTKAVIVEKGAK